MTSRLLLLPGSDPSLVPALRSALGTTATLETLPIAPGTASASPVLGLVADLRADPALDPAAFASAQGFSPRAGLPLLLLLPPRLSADRVDALLARPGAEIFSGAHALRALCARARALAATAAPERTTDSESRLRKIVDSLPVMVWMTGPDGRATWYNQRWLDFRGRGLAEEVGDGWLEGIHPDDRERCYRTFMDCFEGRVPYHLEYRLRRHDGEWRWVSDQATPIRDEDGGVSGYIGGCVDITGHRLLEEDMRRSRDNLTAILRGVRSAVMVVDGEGRIHYANHQAAVHMGYASAEDLMANDQARIRGRYEICDEAGNPFPVDRLPSRVAFREGRDAEAVIRYRQKGDAGWRWTLAKSSPILDAAGKVSRAVEIMEDITSFKQAEMEAKAARGRLDVILQGIDNGILVHEPSGRLAYLNAVGARLAGYASVEAALSAPADAFPGRLALADEAGNALPRERWPAYSALRGEEHPAVLLRLRAGQDGPERWVMCGSKPVRDGEEKGFLAVTILQDVTDLRFAEEQLRQSQKMDAVGKLAGGIAHDFNNLLTAINGYSQLALAHQGSLDEVREYMQEVAAAGEKASGLTRQLLSFSRKQIVSQRPLSLNECVAGLGGLLSRLIGEDIRFTTALDAAIPPVLGDKAQVDQVLMNLCLNARDAMPAGGSLHVETRLHQVSARGWYGNQDIRPGPYVQLEVSDTGVGMSPAVRGRVFEPFFTTKSKDKGTGLGLSTVYSIVKQMGGNIHVTSAEGKGTTFRLLFPGRATASADAPAPGPGLSAEGAAGKESVLLVEDDVRVQRLAVAVLRARGYTVHAFSEGETAVEWVRTSSDPIHLLLSDVVLPGMGGAEVVSRIRELRPGLTVALMSGYTDDALVRKGVGDSRIPFLQKPFVPSGLLAFVGALVAPGKAAVKAGAA